MKKNYMFIRILYIFLNFYFLNLNINIIIYYIILKMLSISFTILCLIHMIVWLFVIFAGFISYKCNKIILLYLIPLIYIIHIMPFHIFLKKKFKEIYDDIDNQTKIFTQDNINTVTNNELLMCKDAYSSLPPNLSKDKQNLIIKIYILQENKYIIPKVYRNIRKYFVNCFGDPLSPQGMLILGYIINTYLLFYYWKKIK